MSSIECRHWHDERLSARDWKPGMRTDKRVIEDVSPEFHGRVLVKFEDRPFSVVFCASTIYALQVPYVRAGR